MRYLSAAVLAVALNCNAAIVAFYTNQTAWETAVGTFSTENFNAVPLQTFPAGSTTLGQITFTYPTRHVGAHIEEFPAGSGNHQLVGMVGIDGNPFFGDLPAYNDITLPWAATAFGGNWQSASSAGQLVLSIPGATFSLPTYLPSPGNGFFGFISDTSFTTLRITPLTTNVNNPGEQYEIDNIKFNNSAAVPEPGAYVVLIAGLGAVWARRRRA